MADQLRQFAFYNPTAGYMDTAALNDKTQLAHITLTGSGSIAIEANNNIIRGVATPQQSTDAVNKSYVDGLVNGVDWKNSVKAATTANVNLANPGTAVFDSITVSNGDRVLVKDQTTQSQNGIYIFNGAAVAMTRAPDADEDGELTPGTAVFIEQGTTYGDTGWLINSDGAITVGTTNFTWTQFTSMGAVNGGAGLVKNGSDIDVGKGDGILVGADSVSIDLDTNSGLQFIGANPNGKLAAKPDTNRALNKDANGLYVALATNPALQFTGGALDWKPDTARGLNKDANGGFIIISASGGLGFSNTNLYVKLDSNSGLQTLSTGLSILEDPAGGLSSTASGLKVVAGNGISVGANVAAAANTAQGINVGASGIGITLNPTNPGLAFTSTYVDTKLNPSGGLMAYSAGIGIDLEASNPSLQIVSNELGIKFNSAGGLEKLAAGVGIKVVANTGLQANASGLAGVANTAQSINVGASGIGLTLNATPGLTHSSGLMVLANTSGGLEITGGTGGGVKVKLNGSTLGLSTSGLAVLGLPSAFTVNGTAVSASVTAVALNSLVNGTDSSTQHLHKNLVDSVSASASVGGVSAGQGLYYSANNTVGSGSCNTAGKDNIVGVAGAAATAGSLVQVVKAGIVTGAVSAATAGTAYYLGPTGLPVTATSLSSGNRVIRLGYAINATDLDVRIEDIGVKP